MKLNNFFFLILALFLIAFVIRITGSKEALFFDETSVIDALLDTDSLGVNTMIQRRPPLGLWLWHIITSIFGMNIFGVRMFSIIFGMLTIFMIYKISENMYSKKVAFFSTLLVTFSFYHILNSLVIQETPFGLFLYCGTLYFYLNYEQKNKRKDMLLTGLFLGAILLNDYTGGIFFIIIAIYKLIKSLSLKKTIFNLFPLFLIAFLVYSIFPLIYLFKNPATFYETIIHVIRNIENPFVIPFLAKVFALFIWATPFLLSFFIFNLFYLEKKDLIFYIWIILGVGFNMFILHFGDFSRYFMIVIPPLCILGGKVLSKIKFNKKWIIGILSFIIFYAIFAFLNLKSRIIYPHLINYYIESVKAFKFNFMMPYAIASGSWFGVSFIAIIVMILACLIFFILSLIWFLLKKEWKYFFIIFIGISFSYNIFLAGELLLHLTQPDHSKIIYEMVEFFKENDLPKPVYTTDRGITGMIYNFNDLKKKRWLLWDYRISETNVDKVVDKLKVEGGTVLYLNFNAKFYRKRLDELSNCKIIKTFSDKGQKIGYIYECVKNH